MHVQYSFVAAILRSSHVQCQVDNQGIWTLAKTCVVCFVIPHVIKYKTSFLRFLILSSCLAAWLRIILHYCVWIPNPISSHLFSIWLSCTAWDFHITFSKFPSVRTPPLRKVSPIGVSNIHEKKLTWLLSLVAPTWGTNRQRSLLANVGQCLFHICCCCYQIAYLTAWGANRFPLVGIEILRTSRCLCIFFLVLREQNAFPFEKTPWVVGGIGRSAASCRWDWSSRLARAFANITFTLATLSDKKSHTFSPIPFSERISSCGCQRVSLADPMGNKH